MELSDLSKDLISAVVSGLKTKYSGDIDFIGVYSHLCPNSTVIEANNINFLIIKRKKSKLELSRYFVFGGVEGAVCHIETKSWEWLESLIGRWNAGKVLLTKTIYFRDADAQENFLRIRRLCEDYLLSPITSEKLQKIAPLVSALKISNSDVNTADKKSVKFMALNFLETSAKLLTELNCGYFRYRYCDRIKDIELLGIIPPNYKKYYLQILQEDDEREIKKYSNLITADVYNIFEKINKIYTEKRKLSKPEVFARVFAVIPPKIQDVKSAQSKISYAIGAYELANSVIMLQKVGVKVKADPMDYFVLKKGGKTLAELKQDVLNDLSYRDFDIETLADLKRIEEII